MQVVILAGGLGTRLRPITEQVPKPMVPVGGRPFLEYIVEHVAEQGFRDLLLLLGYLGEQVQQHFGDGRKWGIAIDYAREASPLGTAGAIRNALSKVESEFVLLYGDSFLPIDYRTVVQAFRRTACDALVIAYEDVTGSTDVNPNLAIDAEGNVMRYQKGSTGIDLKYIEAGALCFRRAIFEGLPPGQVISLEEQMFPELIAQHSLRAFITQQRFFDVGTPGRLREFAATL